MDYSKYVYNVDLKKQHVFVTTIFSLISAPVAYLILKLLGAALIERANKGEALIL